MKSLPYLASALACGFTLHFFAPPTARAGSATWNLNPVSGDWNMATNWTPATVPNGPTDMATFGVSNTSKLLFSANPVEVSSIVFNPGASSFNITLDPAFTSAHLILSGAGIINNSGVTENVILGSPKNGNSSLLEFLNATASFSRLWAQ